MTPLAAYMLLFVAVGTGFIFVHLVAGKLIRPSKPHSEKATIYECGEPTIGSAWIQFDLRFYVVALLFVIFDVEVAFFFPWAEVFGKANAVANAPDPKSAAEYNDLGEKILDLAIRSDVLAGQLNQLRWEKMRTLTEEELVAYRSFSPLQARFIGSRTKDQFDALIAITPEERAQIKQANASLRATFADQSKKRDDAMTPFLVAAKKRPEGDRNILELNKTDRESDQQTFDNAPLSDFVAGRVPFMMFVRPPMPGTPDRPRPLYLATRALDPAAFRAATALADKQIAVFQQQAGIALANLQKADPGKEVLWNSMTPRLMNELDALTDDQALALTKLEQVSLMLLSDTTVKTAKEEAKTLAWMALGEILFFFGVLLVGFAYLWKRGDLAWVRATIAEQGQFPIAPPTAILPVALPLEPAGVVEHTAS